MNAIRLSARPVGRRLASSAAAPTIPKQPVPVSLVMLLCSFAALDASAVARSVAASRLVKNGLLRRSKKKPVSNHRVRPQADTQDGLRTIVRRRGWLISVDVWFDSLLLDRWIRRRDLQSKSGWVVALSVAINQPADGPELLQEYMQGSIHPPSLLFLSSFLLV